MAFTSYITYQDYTALGGIVPESDFANVERKAQRQLDSYTFDRIKQLTTIPDEVKEVLTEYINKIYANEKSSVSSSLASSYSNGVESITYKENAEAQFNNSLVNLAVDWLPSYLTARSVNFDVSKYLQSDSNNS